MEQLERNLENFLDGINKRLKIIEFWIAKDKDGMVYLFEEMPYKKDDYFLF